MEQTPMDQTNEQLNAEQIEFVKPEIKPVQNQLQRAINIIVSPMSTIEDIKIKSNFLLPLAIIWVVGIISTFLTKDLVQELVDITYANAGMSADQIASTKEMMSGYMAAMMYVGILLLPLGAIFKGIVSHLFSILLGGKGSFGATVSLMLNAYIIQMAGTLIALPIILLTGNGAFSFSPAILLPIEKYGTPLFSTLQGLNIFTIWYLIVTFMGIKKIQDVPAWKAALIIFIPTIIAMAFPWVSVMLAGAPSGM